MFFGQEVINRKDYTAGFILIQIYIALLQLHQSIQMAYTFRLCKS
jgi:hypothetical protein